MLKTGVLNPAILSLLARVRHTNMLVIADRGFPFWPSIETVDISLIDDVPTVLQVLQAVTTLVQVFSPPRDNGTRWSRVRHSRWRRSGCPR